MSQRATRDSWQAYCEEHGLVDYGARHGPEPPAPRSAKYGNKKTVVNGITFDSKKESCRYQELRFMQQAKQIDELELQPAFPLHVMRLAYSEIPIRIVAVGSYVADFQYTDLRTGEIVIEDVKSEATKTPIYKLKKKLVEVIHGVTITEV